MKMLAFAASLRTGSINRKLAAQTVALLKRVDSGGLIVDHADFRDFTMPMYDGDVEERDGLPTGAKEMIQRVQGADAVIIATPEYNGSIPGTLKNAMDWVSRVKPIPFKDKPVLLLGATPGAFAAVRGLWHTRVPLEVMGAYVYPEMMGVARAHQAFDGEGRFVEKAQEERLEGLLQGYLAFVRKLGVV